MSIPVCTLSYKGVWYDLSDFIDNHPGGLKVLEKYNGKEIDEIFSDPSSHIHSSFAQKILEQQQKIFIEKSAEKMEDQEGLAFIDLQKPMISQILNASWSKEFYFENVNVPQTLKGSPRFFENSFLEAMTKSPWYLIPLFWIPLVIFLFVLNVFFYSFKIRKTGTFFFIGLLSGSLKEYITHRFYYHISSYFIPNNQLIYAIHFTIHGYHHYCPKDLSRVIQTPLFVIFHAFWDFLALFLLFGSVEIALIIETAQILLYSLIEIGHLYAHKYGTMNSIHSNHLKHHYDNYDKNFTLSNSFWFYPFWKK